MTHTSQLPLPLPLPLQATRYESRHQEIMAAADTVFADAGEEFASIASVKAQLEEFKSK